MSAEPAGTSATRQQSNILAALGWMTIALLCFSTFAVAGRQAGKEIDPLQIMLWRGPISLVLLAIVALVTGARARTHALPLQITRNIFHFGAQFSWLTALGLIPLAELFALEFTAPLWVAILAPLVLGERLTGTRLIAALLGFVGVIIVVQPGSQPLSVGMVFALASALGFAASMVTTKILTRTDSAFTILVYMMGIQTVFALVLGLPGFVLPSAVTLAWVFVLSVAGLVAHFSLASAFKRADAILVAPMDFLRLPLIATVGALVYGEALDPLVAVGAAVIIAANLLNIRGERKAR